MIRLLMTILLIGNIKALSIITNNDKLGDENELNELFKNKREVDTNTLSNSLQVEIKSNKFQSPKSKSNEMYVIESQQEFFIECEISSKLGEEPQVYWWFKPKSKNSIKFIKKPNMTGTNGGLSRRSRELNDNHKTNKTKVTFVSKIFIDCPSIENEGEYYCAAIDYNRNFYHISKVKLNVIVPETQNITKSAIKSKPCQTSSFKLFGSNNPARIIEYTQVIFNYENESVLLKCRTEDLKQQTRPIRLFRNPKYRANKPKRNVKQYQAIKFDYSIEHIWLDNQNKQIKESNDKFELIKNGDLLIKNLTFEQRGQFACITRKGNLIDSVSAFIFPLRNEEDI